MEKNAKFTFFCHKRRIIFLTHVKIFQGDLSHFVKSHTQIFKSILGIEIPLFRLF